MPTKMKKDDDEDDDLKDLLTSSSSTKKSNNKNSTRNVPGYYAGPKMSLMEFGSAYIAMMCFYYPICCCCLFFILLIGFTVLLSTFFFNPVELYGDAVFGNIQHDHTNIASVYDLKMGDIDHWCLGGTNDNCLCEDPLQPVGRINHKSWIQAFKANKAIITQSMASSTPLDVAFLGESISTYIVTWSRY
jgi:hypothetical protein